MAQILLQVRHSRFVLFAIGEPAPDCALRACHLLVVFGTVICLELVVGQRLTKAQPTDRTLPNRHLFGADTPRRTHRFLGADA